MRRGRPRARGRAAAARRGPAYPIRTPRWRSAPSRGRRGPASRPSGRGCLRLQAPALLVGLESCRELVQLALEDRIEVVRGQLDAVIGDPALAVVVRADLLGAVAGAALRAAVGGELGLLLGDRALVQARAKHAHRLLAVLQLGLLVLHRD